MNSLRILLLLCCLSFASLLAKEPMANSQSPVASQVSKDPAYQKAMSEFNNKNYEEAFKLFGELFDKYPASELVNFYYGRSAYELQNFDFAFGAFDRVLIANPMNHRARLELGRTLFMLEAYDEARVEFEKVLASPIPPEVRSNVEKFLAMLDEKRKGYIFKALAILGVGWDDNLDSATDEFTNNLISSFTNSNREKKEDFHTNVILVGNLIVPFKSNEKLAWESNGVIYVQKQDKYDKNDVYLTAIKTGLSYISGQMKNTLSVSYDYIWLDRESLINYYGIEHQLLYRIDGTNLLESNIKFREKEYIQDEDSDRDSDILELQLRYTKEFENDSSLTLSTTFNRERRKEVSSRTDVSKDILRLKASYKKRFLQSYTLDLSHEYEEEDYRIASSSGTTTFPTRLDDKHTSSIKVTKSLNQAQNVSAEFQRTDNKSNNNLYSYENNSVNINYTIAF